MPIVLEQAAPADPVLAAARALAEAARAAEAPYTLGSLLRIVAAAAAPLAEGAADMSADDHVGIAAFLHGEAQRCAGEWGDCVMKTSDLIRSRDRDAVRQYHSQAAQLADETAGHMMGCCYHLGAAAAMPADSPFVSGPGPAPQ